MIHRQVLLSADAIYCSGVPPGATSYTRRSMADLKTRLRTASVAAFLGAIKDDGRRKDSRTVAALMTRGRLKLRHREKQDVS